jgi:geranylgeranyl diphosphate synthase type II
VRGEDRLAGYREIAEARMAELLPPDDWEPRPLHQAMRYSALAPGKRLRPALCMAACEAVGGKRSQALDAGCALEFVHCFSLIHDDLPAIDDDDLRRGRATCHIVFGEAIAILAGDALMALAFDVLTRMEANDKQKTRAVRILAQSLGSTGLVAGEVLDILSEGEEVDRDLVQRIHAWKTGALISASCEMGALLGGADAGPVEALARYGREVGMAFQIQDDILNETATADQLGKAVGSDRARSKQTFPAAIGLEQSRREADRATQGALHALEGLPGDTTTLRELALYSVSREV